MRIICDVDYVVLNSNAVKAALASANTALGMTPQMFYSAYQRLRERGEWSPEGLSAFLPERLKKNKIAITRKYWQVIDASSRYVYQDARYFLGWCGRQGHAVVLYTYGDSLVQERKLKSLKKMFPHVGIVITTDRAKRRDFKKCVSKKDKWMWLDDFKDVPVGDRAFGGGTLLYVKRSVSQPKISKLPVVNNLYQAAKFINEL